MPPVTGTMGLSESAVMIHLHVDQEFATHETPNHSAKEYARGDVTTNTVEGFCLIFKRGMRRSTPTTSKPLLARTATNGAPSLPSPTTEIRILFLVLAPLKFVWRAGQNANKRIHAQEGLLRINRCRTVLRERVTSRQHSQTISMFCLDEGLTDSSQSSLKS